MKKLNFFFLSILFLLFPFTGCVPATQDTVPISITRAQPTTTPSPTTIPTPTYHPDPAERTIVEALNADGRFTIFLSLLETAEMLPLLNSDGPFTVFAPPDEALRSLPAEAIQTLETDSQIRIEFLQRHITPERLTNRELTDHSIVCDVYAITTTLGSDDLRYGTDDFGRTAIHLTYHDGNEGVDTHDIVIEETDLRAKNGIIHLIRTPILPFDSPWYQASITEVVPYLYMPIQRTAATLYEWEGGGFCRYEGRIRKLSSDGGKYTLFLPTDAAWSAVENEFGIELIDDITLADIMSYHILVEPISRADLTSARSVPTLSGQQMTISAASDGKFNMNGVDVKILAEIQVAEGVVYVIDTLFAPPNMDLAHLPPTILRALQAESEFQRVLSLWNENDLTSSIMDHSGPFTIFVVTDSTLASLSDEQLESINQPDSPYSLYHVIMDETNLEPGTQLVTWWNITLDVALNGSEITIGNDEAGRATIIRTIEASNGIIYVLDRPLVPLQ